MTRTRISMLVLCAAVGLALLASACGGSPANGVAHIGATTGSAAPHSSRNALAFARCMRRHGVNVPDDMADTPATPWGDAPGVHAALGACKQLMPPGHSPHRPSAQELKQLLAYAVCMRAHGIEAADPDPATGDVQIHGYTRPRMQTDPVYKAADTACKDKLPGWVQRKQSGRGPAGQLPG